MLNVAVVGSGPAGLYAAEALVKQAAALPLPVPLRVDVIDRLPTPYGLVRYGVAPDHKSIKSIAQYLRKVLESPDVRFVGGVHLGEDVTRDDLVSAYDAVIYATGAMRDRRLGIPGEDLPGSYAATDFVNWYCGHPDIDSSAFTLDAESVAVIGVGNVAVDVARILARDPAELHATDVPQPVLDALHASKVREVHMIGRRGPAYAKFTTKELRELGELPCGQGGGPRRRGRLEHVRRLRRGARAGGIRPAGPRQPGRDIEVGARRHKVRRAPARARPAAGGQVLAEAGGNPGDRASDRCHPRTDGYRRQRGLRRHRSRAKRSAAQMVLRSVGYQSVPLPGVPFDPRASVVPNALGRVLGEDGSPLPGEYVAGWLKRGPTGVIGTNKSDAAETVRCLLEDLAGGPGAGDVALPRAGLLQVPRPGRSGRRTGRPLTWPRGTGRWRPCSPGAESRRSPTRNGCASRPRKRTWPRHSAGASGSSCTTATRSGPPAVPKVTSGTTRSPPVPAGPASPGPPRAPMAASPRVTFVREQGLSWVVAVFSGGVCH